MFLAGTSASAIGVALRFKLRYRLNLQNAEAGFIMVRIERGELRAWGSMNQAQWKDWKPCGFPRDAAKAAEDILPWYDLVQFCNE